MDTFLNKIIQGDCLEVMKGMPDKCVDLICTDPPYLIGAQGCGLAGDRDYLHKITEGKIDSGFDFSILREFKRVLKHMNLVVFCGRLQLKDYLDWIYVNDYTWNLICWHKKNPTPLTNNNYLPDTEYVFHIWENRKLTGSYATKKKFYISNVIKNNIDHPTVKPVDLVKNLIENASDNGDIILDPFLGSGTTAVAAKQLSRNFIGIEISPEYCAIANRRLASTTSPLF